MPELVVESERLIPKYGFDRKQSLKVMSAAAVNKKVSLGGLLGAPNEVLKRSGLSTKPLSPSASKLSGKKVKK